MNWKFWQSQPRPQTPDPKTKFVLHGWNEAQFRQAFLTAPDSDLHKGVLEQCDLSLMEAVNELVNGADEMSDGVLRQRVGELRGITELRASFELRAEQARKDQQAVATGTEEKKEDGGLRMEDGGWRMED